MVRGNTLSLLSPTKSHGRPWRDDMSSEKAVNIGFANDADISDIVGREEKWYAGMADEGIM